MGKLGSQLEFLVEGGLALLDQTAQAGSQRAGHLAASDPIQAQSSVGSRTQLQAYTSLDKTAACRSPAPGRICRGVWPAASP